MKNQTARYYVNLTIIALILSACGVDQTANDATESPAPTEAPDPLNATITGIYDNPLTLTDGRYEGDPFQPDSPIRPTVYLANELTLEGDLDNDGTPETIAFVEENSGGTGHFLYIVALAWRGGTVENVGTMLIGDRVDIRDARIENETVLLDLVQAGPGDAACCPSQIATRSWKLDNGTLEELPETIEGQLSLALLNDTAWTLRAFGNSPPPSDEVQLTLTFENGGIAGFAGCNQFSATIASGDNPGDIAIGPLAGTKKLCPPPIMDLEREYHAALQGASRFTFFQRKLAIQYEVNGEFGQLYFESNE